MDIDLPYYLFWASVISGAIWAVDTWFFKPSRLAKADSSGAVAEPVLVEYARSFFPIFVAGFLLRSFVAEPYQIPSESIDPAIVSKKI